MGKLIDLTGQRFGFWKVLNKKEKNKSGQTQWLCECDCGTQKTVTSNSLRTGNSTSCGCNHAPNLENKKFGKLTVIRADHSKNKRQWICKCECGNLFITNTYKLRNGNITSCGCQTIWDITNKSALKILEDIYTVISKMSRDNNLTLLPVFIPIIYNSQKYL